MTTCGVPASEIAQELDALLEVASTPDYGGALNGLQVDHAGTVHGVAAAVDASLEAIEATVAAGANLLLVHHGLFWGGAQAVRGVHYRKLKTLLDHDVAVYAAHLPLDRHGVHGNNVLLARALGLAPAGTWHEYKGVTIGVTAECDLATDELVARTRSFAGAHGHHVVVAGSHADRRTRRVAICTGGGASSESLRECLRIGADTLVTGEGPHHTAVEAREHGIAVIYAGHYATETLGVRSLATWVGARWGVPVAMIDAPTGL